MSVVARKQLHPDAPIGGNGFFPELSLDDFQKTQRVDSTAPVETLRDVLQSAIARIQRGALDWQCQQIQLGYLSLEAVPADTVGNETVLVLAYRLAAYLRAKGELLKHFANITLTEKGVDDVERKFDHSAFYFNQSARELRVLIGKPVTRVSTI
ncbi:MAG: hypothetical protein BWK73_04805 [Thiothrix lacustris]|uniref:Phage head protein n=1 Tax=Thiothrix lacustris TaxID=525917 RepID=A0A1Y1QXQ0_9GAMM|nr:MAG: hypothetical protein BWK73_04805 [Thiothrix lacustris]